MSLVFLTRLHRHLGKQGLLTDSVMVRFYTNATVFNNEPANPNVTGSVRTGVLSTVPLVHSNR